LKLTKSQLKQIVKEEFETVLREASMPRGKAEKLLQQMKDFTGNQELTPDEAVEGIRWQFGSIRLDPVEGVLHFSNQPGKMTDNERYLYDAAKDFFGQARAGETKETEEDDSSWHDRWVADMCSKHPESCASLIDPAGETHTGQDFYNPDEE